MPFNVMVNHRSSRTMHEQCMKPHRSRTEIVIRILEIVSGNGSDGSTKYKIMYNAFLSYAQLKEYLTVLTDNDLLRYDLDSHTFKTTEKGRRFLEIYNYISDFMKTH
jgi:predicted transcriptional regulator